MLEGSLVPFTVSRSEGTYTITDTRPHWFNRRWVLGEDDFQAGSPEPVDQYWLYHPVAGDVAWEVVDHSCGEAVELTPGGRWTFRPAPGFYGICHIVGFASDIRCLLTIQVVPGSALLRDLNDIPILPYIIGDRLRIYQTRQFVGPDPLESVEELDVGSMISTRDGTDVPTSALTKANYIDPLVEPELTVTGVGQLTASLAVSGFTQLQLGPSFWLVRDLTPTEQDKLLADEPAMAPAEETAFLNRCYVLCQEGDDTLVSATAGVFTINTDSTSTVYGLVSTQFDNWALTNGHTIST